MSTIANLEVKIGADTKGLNTGLNKMSSLAKSAGVGLAKVGAIGVAALGTGMVMATREGVKGIIAYENATAQMNAVLKSTKNASGMTTKALQEQAKQMQLTTKFAEEDVMAGQNMLLTFTKIGKDVFPQATVALSNLATAMGTDMKSSAIQMGKALNDPTQGLTALRRVGIMFSDEQKAVIKRLQETGDMAGAQKIIIEELNKEFGGSAVAAGKTYEGMLVRMKNALGELAEGMAGGIMPGLTNMITMVNEAANGTRTWESAATGIGKSFGEIAKVLVEALGKAIPVVMSMISSLLTELLKTLPKLLPMVAKVILDLINVVLNTLKSNGKQIIDAAFLMITTLLDGIVQAMPLLIDTCADLVIFIVDGLINNLGAIIGAAVQIVIALVNGIVRNLDKITDATVKIIESLTKELSKKDNISKLIEASFKITLALAKGLIKSIPTIIGAVVKITFALVNSFKDINWVQLGSEIINGIASGMTSALGSLGNTIKNIGGTILDKFKDVFKISSPSKVMSDLVGVNLGLGVMDGLSKSLNIDGLLKNIKGTINIQSNQPTIPSRSITGQINNALNNSSGENVTVNVTLDGKVIARAIAPYNQMNARNRSRGLGAMA